MCMGPEFVLESDSALYGVLGYKQRKNWVGLMMERSADYMYVHNGLPGLKFSFAPAVSRPRFIPFS